MRENLDIKTIHHQIERLRPIWKKMEQEIEKDIQDPASTEFVVRTNEREEYFLLIIKELLDMYDAYILATNKIISIEPTILPKKQDIEKPIENLDINDEDLDENNIDEEEEFGIIKKAKPLEMPEKIKAKLGRRPNYIVPSK